MKYCIIVPDGMADYPIDEIGNRTPLEAANTPNLDHISLNGKLEQVRTIPRGMSCGSDVANLSILSYDPKEYYSGRAPLEAASMGLSLDEGNWAFRCNLVTVDDGILADFSAGHISTEEAKVLIELIGEKLGSDDISFHSGVSYRHIMIYSGGEEFDLTTDPPHDIIGEPINDHLPRGKGSELLKQLMFASRDILSNHEINKVRIDLGENPANMIWFWGQGQSPPPFPSFKEKFGKTGAAISAVDLVKTIATLIGWDVIEVPGATGYYDTDYEAKGRYAIDALKRYDLVFVHIESPDEASHNGEVLQKIRAIESIDEKIVGPILHEIESYDAYRILILPDHYTPIVKRTHAGEPVPFAIYGTGIEPIKQVPFTEAMGTKADLKIEEGHKLMEYFLGVA